MNQRIIYPNDEGGVSVIVPSPNCEHTIEEIAAKDVPVDGAQTTDELKAIQVTYQAHLEAEQGV